MPIQKSRRFSFPGAEKSLWLWSLFLLFLLVVLVYLPVAHFEFINFDDEGYVYDNTMVRQGLSLETIRWAFRTNAMGYWHPLTWLSHLLDVSLFGLWAGGHHLTSLALHLFNTALLIILIVKATGHRWPALLVGALFALHPTRVEPVIWISERKDLLSTALLFLAALAYLKWVKSRQWQDYGLTILAFTTGLMAKPMLVTFPLVLLLLDRWPLKRYGAANCAEMEEGGPQLRWYTALKLWIPPVRLWLEKIPLLLLTIAFSLLTLHAHQGAIASTRSVPVAERISTALSGYGRYLWELVWPVNLSAIYIFQRVRPLWPPVLAGFVLLTVTTLLLARRRWAPYAVGWFIFLGILVPVIGLVQVGVGGAADRFTYVPYVGLFGILIGAGTAWAGAGQGPARLRIGTAVALAVLTTLALLSVRQVSFWHDSRSLFTRAVELNPTNAEAWFLLGDDSFARQEYPRAIQYYAQGLQFRPVDPKALQNLAASYLFAGQLEASITIYRQVVSLYPKYELARRNLAKVLAIQALRSRSPAAGTSPPPKVQ